MSTLSQGLALMIVVGSGCGSAASPQAASPPPPHGTMRFLPDESILATVGDSFSVSFESNATCDPQPTPMPSAILEAGGSHRSRSPGSTTRSFGFTFAARAEGTIDLSFACAGGEVIRSTKVTVLAIDAVAPEVAWLEKPRGWPVSVIDDLESRARACHNDAFAHDGRVRGTARLYFEGKSSGTTLTHSEMFVPPELAACLQKAIDSMSLPELGPSEDNQLAWRFGVKRRGT